MSVTIQIKQSGLFKKILTVPEIAVLGNMKYGISDEYFCLKEGELDQVSLLYNPDNLARGIEVFYEDSDINLRLGLPTTGSEIRAFYDLAEKICQKLKVKEFLRDDNPAFPAEKENYIRADISTSVDALMDIHDKISSDENNFFIILGVTNPISLSIIEMNRISGDYENFEKLLHRLQKMDAYYAKPHVYGRRDDSSFACYAVGEGIVSVVPTKPYILMGEDDIQDWYVLMPENTIVRYDDFINNVGIRDYYDANHVIVCLTAEEIQNFKTNFQTEI